jgi:predicted dehydrogenase
VTIRWGVAGTGVIAGAFVAALREMGTGVVAAVASDDPERAAAFAAAHDIPVSVAPHEALASAAGLDAVYVATTNDRHVGPAVACLEAGIPVLCEKPMALSARQAERIVEAARRSATFLMEAWWSRFLPFFAEIQRIVAGGDLGPVRWVQADLGFPARVSPMGRLWSPDRGGGALLDIGIYPLSLAHALVGAPEETRAVAGLTELGVDAQVGVVSRHREGSVSVLSASFTADTAMEATIAGPGGRIRVHAPFHHSPLLALHRAGATVAVRDVSYDGSGYRFEIEEVHRCLEAGLMESALRPLADTLAVMNWMDEVRRQVGVHYPGE